MRPAIGGLVFSLSASGGLRHEAFFIPQIVCKITPYSVGVQIYFFLPLTTKHFFKKNMIDIESLIRDIPDFPKPGVVFKDITPLLMDAKAIAYCTEELANLTERQHVDKVVGIESRGFFFATLLAKELNAGFVPLRKAGKLPYHTLKEPYLLEYGMDSLEIHEDAISKGDKVVLHDDVLATGGTAQAACKLIEKLGGEIVQCNFLIELSFLRGSDKIRRHDIRSLLTY